MGGTDGGMDEKDGHMPPGLLVQRLCPMPMLVPCFGLGLPICHPISTEFRSRFWHILCNLAVFRLVLQFPGFMVSKTGKPEKPGKNAKHWCYLSFLFVIHFCYVFTSPYLPHGLPLGLSFLLSLHPLHICHTCLFTWLNPYLLIYMTHTTTDTSSIQTMTSS
jgi:hypothetical protein